MATQKPLSPPPKFQGGKGSGIIGPQTPGDWDDFYRWLFAQYRAVANLVGTSEPMSVFPGLPSAPSIAVSPGQFPAAPLPFADTTAANALRGFPAAPYHSRNPIEILICTQATFPVLTAGSIPVFVFVSDYAHLIYWNGTTATFAGDQSGCISLWESDPGTGYHLCDGSTVSRLNADGTKTSVTLPDLTSSGAAAAFLEGGTPNSGPTAAVAPTISGHTDTGTAVIAGTTASGAAAIGNDTDGGITFLAAGLGSTAAINPHTHIDSGHTHDSGTIADSGHQHTLSSANAPISATGEPRKLVRRPFYRL